MDCMIAIYFKRRNPESKFTLGTQWRNLSCWPQASALAQSVKRKQK